jgi:excisionase family DNA binding protein
MHLRSATAEEPGRKPARPAADPLAYTLNDASAVSGLSRSTLYRHEKAGRLRMLRVGGRRLVDAASLRALLGADA